MTRISPVHPVLKKYIPATLTYFVVSGLTEFFFLGKWKLSWQFQGDEIEEWLFDGIAVTQSRLHSCISGYSWTLRGIFFEFQPILNRIITRIVIGWNWDWERNSDIGYQRHNCFQPIPLPNRYYLLTYMLAKLPNDWLSSMLPMGNDVPIFILVEPLFTHLIPKIYYTVYLHDARKHSGVKAKWSINARYITLTARKICRNVDGEIIGKHTVTTASGMIDEDLKSCKGYIFGQYS